MEKILLSFDNRGFDKALRSIKADLEIYNNLINVIVENTDKIAVNIENIEKVLNDPKEFLFDLIVDNVQMSFNGLPINKKKAIDLVDFPEEFNKVISTSLNAKNLLIKDFHQIDSDTQIDRLKLQNVVIKNNVAECTEPFLNDLKDEFCSYTRNENQNEALKLMKIFDEMISELLKLGFVPAGRQLEDLKLGELGFKFYDSKRSIDLDQIRRIR